MGDQGGLVFAHLCRTGELDKLQDLPAQAPGICGYFCPGSVCWVLRVQSSSQNSLSLAKILM